MSKKKKKNKKKKADLFTATKRIRITKRLPKKKKSPFKIIVKNWGVEPFESDFQKEIQLNEDSSLEIRIDNATYQVSIDKKNRCLKVNTHETHLYIQPISVHTFLVKANSKTKEDEN